MNTDRIFAEQIVNEYAPKDTSKVVTLRKLDKQAKLPANIFTYSVGIVSALKLDETYAAMNRNIFCRFWNDFMFLRMSANI